jgi:hypothetical protein
VLVGAFGLIESCHRVPLVPLRIFRSRTLAGADALTVLRAPQPEGPAPDRRNTTNP